MTPPSQIAHYRITSKFGEGDMGVVYRAIAKLNRDVAIKVLPPAFCREAFASRPLHPLRPPLAWMAWQFSEKVDRASGRGRQAGFS
jgi:serine/threonine protein kinase